MSEQKGTRWSVEVSGEMISAMEMNDRFIAIMRLMRVINGLNSTINSMRKIDGGDIEIIRDRINLFFLSCSQIFEVVNKTGVEVVEKFLDKEYGRKYKEFLDEVSQRPAYKVAKLTRNKIAFHQDENVIKEGLNGSEIEDIVVLIESDDYFDGFVSCSFADLIMFKYLIFKVTGKSEAQLKEDIGENYVTDVLGQMFQDLSDLILDTEKKTMGLIGDVVKDLFPGHVLKQEGSSL